MGGSSESSWLVGGDSAWVSSRGAAASPPGGNTWSADGVMLLVVCPAAVSVVSWVSGGAVLSLPKPRARSKNLRSRARGPAA